MPASKSASISLNLQPVGMNQKTSMKSTTGCMQKSESSSGTTIVYPETVCHITTETNNDFVQSFAILTSNTNDKYSYIKAVSDGAKMKQAPRSSPPTGPLKEIAILDRMSVRQHGRKKAPNGIRRFRYISAWYFHQLSTPRSQPPRNVKRIAKHSLRFTSDAWERKEHWNG